MSIRSRIANFEARNQELRNATVRGKQQQQDDRFVDNEDSGRNNYHLNEPFMSAASAVNNNNNNINKPKHTTLAGRLGTTKLVQQQRQQEQSTSRVKGKNGAAVSNQSTPLPSDEIAEPPRVQRYQPLHQQYHQRQAQHRKHHQQFHHHEPQQQHEQQGSEKHHRSHPEQAPRLQPPGGAEEQSPVRPAMTRNGMHQHSHHRTSMSPHRRTQHHQRRLEQMRRLEDTQRKIHESQHHHHQQMNGHYLADSKHKDETSTSSSSPPRRGAVPQHSEQPTTASNKFTKTSTTAQRLAKIQRMQRSRVMEKGRQNDINNDRPDQSEEMNNNSIIEAAAATTAPASYGGNGPPSPDHNAGLARDLSLQASAADDEITLTSVRQILGTATEYSASPLGKGKAQQVYPDEMTYTDDRDWPEEKSEKARGHHYQQHHHAKATSKTKASRRTRRVTSVSSSSSEDEEGQRQTVPAITSQLTPDVSSFFEESQRRFLQSNSPRADGDEEGEDQASQGSESFAQRKERERREQVAREAAVQKAKAEMEGPFLKAEDVDYYQKSMDTPIAKTMAGVAVAATVGCVLLGPMGLLVGTATVGIGYGVMQIPAEQRSNMVDRATQTLQKVSDTALQASESMSASCANTYQDSGLADHVPDEVNNCCAAIQQVPTTTDKSEISVSLTDAKDRTGDMTEMHDDADRGLEEAPKRLPPRRAGAACLREGM